jgi:hypothetical protein
MKKCSISLAIGEKQIETKLCGDFVSPHSAWLSSRKLQQQMLTRMGEPWFTAGGNKLVKQPWKSVFWLIKKKNLQKALSILLHTSWVYIQESQSAYYGDTCTPRHWGVARLRNQPRCPSPYERIQKSWHMYTMESYSTMEKSAIMPFARKWWN